MAQQNPTQQSQRDTSQGAQRDSNQGGSGASPQQPRQDSGIGAQGGPKTPDPGRDAKRTDTRQDAPHVADVGRKSGEPMGSPGQPEKARHDGTGQPSKSGPVAPKST